MLKTWVWMKFYGNEEIRSLLPNGTGFGARLLMWIRPRYQELVIMTDADVDGAHIRDSSIDIDLSLYETCFGSRICLYCTTTYLWVKVGSEVKGIYPTWANQEEELQLALNVILKVAPNQAFSVIKGWVKWMITNFWKQQWTRTSLNGACFSRWCSRSR